MIKTVGVIGAGQMGHGIAHVCALSKYDVILLDQSEDNLSRAVVTIDHNLGRQEAKSLINAGDKAAALARIRTTTDLEDLGDCDLVIEAVVEDEAVKRGVFSDLKAVLSDEAILCSNTSSISITRLGAGTGRPDRFMGMHFMNPVPMMESVELIRGIATGPETFATVKAFAESLGKHPVAVEDFPGFIVNRVLMPMINEAVYALYEGVGSVEAIDQAMKLGAHHPMGPLALADFIGLDVCLQLMHILHEGLADTKYRPCPLLVKYVEAGWIGKAAGKGFYDYAGDTPVPTR